MNSTATRIGLIVFSAILLGVSQTTPALGWLAFIGLVPACLTLRLDRFLSTWATLSLLTALYTLFTCYWIYHYQDGRIALLGFLCIPFYSAIFFSIPAACCWAVRTRSSTARLLLLPAAWTLAETLERHLLLKVTWNLLGQPLAEWPVLAQGAALAGPEFLSYVVAAVNVAIAIHIREPSKKIKAAATLQGFGLLLILLLFGALRLNAGSENAPTLRVGLIQPNIQPAQHWGIAYRQSILAQLDKLIDQTLDKNPDLIVLPESALPGFVFQERDLGEWVSNTLMRTQRPLLFGSLDLGKENTLYNVAVMAARNGATTIHRKIRLVPLTEYTPDISLLEPLFQRLRGGPLKYSPGEERTIFDLEGKVAFATVICFEDIFSNIAREFAVAGAKILISVTNTAELKDSPASLQHFHRARLTAIAIGLPMVRSGNSGISSVIDKNGRLLGQIVGNDKKVLMIAGAGVFSVPIETINTPYRRFGDRLPLATIALLITGSIGWTSLRRLPDIPSPDIS